LRISFSLYDVVVKRPRPAFGIVELAKYKVHSILVSMIDIASGVMWDLVFQ